VLLGQPVKEISGVAGQNFIIVQRGDGLDALLKLFQARLHTFHLRKRIRIRHGCCSPDAGTFT